MKISIKGKLVLPEHNEQFKYLGAFFGYELNQFAKLVDDVISTLKSYQQDLCLHSIGSFLLQYLPTLHDDADGVAKFFILSIMLGGNEGYYEQLAKYGDISLN